jgi:hypothetical protein
MKNILIQEFQHCLEPKLIEVMKMKMHLTWFALMVKVIQMKLMKIDHDLNHMTKKQFQQSEEPKLEKSRIHVDQNKIVFWLFHLIPRGIGPMSTP